MLLTSVSSLTLLLVPAACRLGLEMGWMSCWDIFRQWADWPSKEIHPSPEEVSQVDEDTWLAGSHCLPTTAVQRVQGKGQVCVGPSGDAATRQGGKVQVTLAPWVLLRTPGLSTSQQPRAGSLSLPLRPQ